MAERAMVDITSVRRRLDNLAPTITRVAGAIGLIGLGLSVLMGPLAGWAQFFRSYLVNFAFCLSLALGALFFVLLQHVTRSGWSVVVRRLAEFVAATMPLLALLFVPLLVPVLGGMKELYPWSNADVVAHDELLQGKRPYLNVPFFVGRWVVYFGIWTLLARYFLRRSTEQDVSGDTTLTLRMQRLSAPGLLLFGFTLTFAAFDLLMSLEPHWYSTIFGVYYFAGSVVGFLATLALLLVALQALGRLNEAVTTEHYQDLGKLIFAFVVFWAYIGFSQYLLIWYANLPEETSWFHLRQAGAWARYSVLALVIGHFVVPFLALISRYPKRRKGLLALAAAWVLLLHWFDIYWLVMPGQPAVDAGRVPLHLLDATTFVGLAGLFVAYLATRMGRHALMPERDPRLAESLAFQNV